MIISPAVLAGGIVLVLLGCPAAGQVATCTPPERPFVPSDESSFSEYADLVAEDFEQYFAEITTYFACMDDARQAVFHEAQEVSKEREAFWARADSLGLTEKSAVEHPPMEDGEGIED